MAGAVSPAEHGGDLQRCPFVRLVQRGELDDARRLADLPDEPAVVDWLVAEAQRQLGSA